MADPQNVSIRDVANRAGVHPSTVSLSLRDSPLIAQATKDHVKAVAHELGYRRNPYVAALMTSRRKGRLPASDPVLGFVTAFPDRNGWKKESKLFVDYYRGARQRAKQLGFRLKEVWHFDPSFNSHLSRDAIRGLIIAPLPFPGMPLGIHWHEFCTVALGFTLTTAAIHRVASDHYSSMNRALAECHKLGYRRIGLTIPATSSAKVQERWRAAFLLHQRGKAEKDVIPPLIPSKWTPEIVRGWFMRWRPEVILTTAADDLMLWLASWGCSVPDEVGVASLSCSTWGGSMSGIYQDAELMGSRAADILALLLQRNEFGMSVQPNALLIDGKWNPGKTTRPKAG